MWYWLWYHSPYYDIIVKLWYHSRARFQMHFFKWLFTKMAVSMVSGRDSEQELDESHLMLKNAWLCFRISSSFVGNNPSLHFHSFSEDQGKCNMSGKPSISDFSTILTSDILILADGSHFTWSLQTTPVIPMLSFIDALLRVQAQHATFFRHKFH